MRVVGYLRVSTDDQARSGLGLEAQCRTIETEADRRGWEVEYVKDEGVSGGTPPVDRPGLGSALASVEPEDVLVVAKLDRLSRSIVDFATLLARSHDEGWKLVVLDAQLDTTTAYGKAMANIMAVMAELERDLISQRTRDALASLKAQGVRLGRPREVPDDVVERVVGLRDDGLTLRQIAEELNGDGIPTARASTWHPATVSRVLRSAELDAEAQALRQEVA